MSTITKEDPQAGEKRAYTLKANAKKKIVSKEEGSASSITEEDPQAKEIDDNLYPW